MNKGGGGVKSNLRRILKEIYRMSLHEKAEAEISEVKYAEPLYDEREIFNVLLSLLPGRPLAINKFNRKFEQQLSNYVGAMDAVTVNSGSSALLLAIAALFHDIPIYERNNFEVILPILCHPADVNAVIMNNLRPVFVDIEKDTWNISPTEIEKAINEKTRAIVVVHLLGNPCKMDQIMKIASRNNLYVIEDCCQALGSEFKKKKVGSFGDVGIFSFYGSHHITLGEGGAITTNNKKLDELLRSMRAWGADPILYDYKYLTIRRRIKDIEKRRFTFYNMGFNLKISEMQAAFGVAQLSRLSTFIKRRRENYSIITQQLRKFGEHLILQERTPNSAPAWFAIGITVKEDAPFSKEDLVKWLQSHGIETRPILAGEVTSQPAYIALNKYIRKVGNMQNCKFVYDNSFFIGCHPGMRDTDINHIIKCLNKFFEFNGII